MKNKSRRSQSIQVFVDKIPQSCQEWTSQQILYNSQKVQKTQELQLWLYRSLLACWLLKSMTASTSMVYLMGLPGRSIFYFKRTWQYGWSLPSLIWRNHKRFLDKQGQRGDVWPYCSAPCLAKTNTSCQLPSMLVLDGWWFGFVLQLARLVFIELIMKSVTLEAICPRAKGR